MAREIYKCTKDVGVFTKAHGNEDIQFAMPDKANLSLRPATSYAAWVAKSDITFVVVQEPSTVQYLSDPVHGTRNFQVGEFPPAGGSYFYKNRRTLPTNMRELIQARVAQGWTVSPALQELLAQG